MQADAALPGEILPKLVPSLPAATAVKTPLATKLLTAVFKEEEKPPLAAITADTPAGQPRVALSVAIQLSAAISAELIS